MSDNPHKSGAKPLHTVYTAAYNHGIEQKSALVQKLYNEPHLALLINGDWLPILPGMIIGIVKDRSKLNGIMPLRLLRVRPKIGKEQIDFASYSTDPANTRILKFGVRYSGQHVSGINDADEVIDAAANSQKIGDKDSE